MTKGERTRRNILSHAVGVASESGLDGLTIGRLAQKLDLSKSGLFAHFRSKEALEVQTIEYAAEQFIDAVVRPALKAPRGEGRVRALFDGWLDWARERPGGCVFYALMGELDDRPGPARDRLVQAQKDWRDLIASCARAAVEEGHFRHDLDPDQFAHDVFATFLGGQFSRRLMHDPDSGERIRRAFEALIAASVTPSRRH